MHSTIERITVEETMPKKPPMMATSKAISAIELTKKQLTVSNSIKNFLNERFKPHEEKGRYPIVSFQELKDYIYNKHGYDFDKNKEECCNVQER